MPTNKEGIEYFLWSRKAIREYIEKKYRKTLVPQTISDYTKRWGLSSQRPKKQVTEQDAKKIQTWLEEEYPKIQKQAKKEGAEIHWADETNINLNTNYQKTYALKGATPIAKIPVRKQSFSLVSSVTNQGKMRYMVYKGGMNIALSLKFLKRLSRDTDKKILLILDNLKVHHGKKVQQWAKENEDKITLFSLPPYFPQGNPDEFLNNDITQNIHRKHFPKNEAELKRNIYAFMKSIQKRPERIQSYFKVKSVQYTLE